MADFGITEYLAFASIATAATGAAVSAAASQQAGQARAQSAAYAAAVARNNQTLAEQYAQMETQKGQALEEEKRREIAAREGAIRAFAGASGVEANSGSALRVQEDTAKVGELDVETIRNSAARAAYGYRVKGMDYAAQAQMDEMAGRDAARSGQLGMWSSLIGGASSVSDKWYRYFDATGSRGPRVN